MLHTTRYPGMDGCITKESCGLCGIQILEDNTHATAKEAQLKFTCDPSNVANNHYEAILLLDKPTQSHT